jgi:hypothetical protein
MVTPSAWNCKKEKGEYLILQPYTLGTLGRLSSENIGDE